MADATPVPPASPSDRSSEYRPEGRAEHRADRRPERRPERPADRPLAELLDVYWRGRVPDPVDPGRAGAPTALDELGPSGLTLRGRPLEAGLAAAYRRFTGAG
ncbi:hypothetical protein ACIQ9P_29755 [Kitasatospora sp. NPDC094019]|uniref:hypothetical protein n=1 Tax=Kitasatospora sp. NPDC094019 TaxID=3364091 RepID=UPI003817D254